MPKHKPIFMETTAIEASKTAGQIADILVRAGASSVQMSYGPDRKLIGLAWTMRFGPNEVPFAMPARIEPVYKLLRARRSGFIGRDVDQRLREQAERVGWRQLLRWIEAQVALIEVNMVSPVEVFMPYMMRADGKTAFQYFEETQKLLGPAETK